ncbi:MAG: transposase [Opitutales bacterium]|nr:transposase [Opitutales bacterium]
MIKAWLRKANISSLYIQPDSPWENPFVESFRNECLNRVWFLNLLDARSCIEAFQQEYNAIRPHSSLSYRSPVEYTIAKADPQRSLAITNHPLPMFNLSC